jgi:hypothetical protein
MWKKYILLTSINRNALSDKKVNPNNTYLSTQKPYLAFMERKAI